MIWLEILFGVILVLIGLYILKNKEKGWLNMILLLIGFGTFLVIDGVGISTTPKFNPDLHDCTRWEDCPIFEGEHGKGFNITSDEIGCIYLNQGVVLRQVQVENLNKLLKRGEAKDCVSWQPKQQEKVYVIEVNGTNYSITEGKLREIYCRDNPSHSEGCECVNWQSPDGNVDGASVVDCSQQGEIYIFSFSGKCVIMPSRLNKGVYYEPVVCVEAVPK